MGSDERLTALLDIFGQDGRLQVSGAGGADLALAGAFTRAAIRGAEA